MINSTSAYLMSTILTIIAPNLFSDKSMVVYLLVFHVLFSETWYVNHCCATNISACQMQSRYSLNELIFFLQTSLYRWRKRRSAEYDAEEPDNTDQNNFFNNIDHE
jgi:hypothetical protein